MSLKIKKVEFRDFRNYEHFQLGEIGDLTIFIGHNAIGKTNILEGIQLLTSTTSFRHAQISHMVREGCDSARISMNCADDVRNLDVALQLEAGKKRFLVNGKARAAADVRGVLPSVAFTPDDLELAKKSSSVKRQALDDLGNQLTRNYGVITRDFEKAIRYKNRLLKDEAPQMMVDAINETLVTCASQLFCYRYALYKKMAPHLQARYADIAKTGEGFTSFYQPSWDYQAQKAAEHSGPLLAEADYVNRDAVRDMMTRSIDRHAEDERARHRCLIGPHNDKIYFFLDGRDVSQFASQGQQRSIVLAWKMAEVEMVRQTLGTEPVLLLDDVMSELDEGRRDMLIRNVSDQTQTFITSTDLSPFNDDLLSKARVVQLEQL